MKQEDLEQIRMILREELERVKTKKAPVNKTPPIWKETFLKYREGYYWGPVDATHLKQLRSKFLYMTKDDEAKALELFNAVMQNLPEFYQDKSLPQINSGFNNITNGIRTKRQSNGGTIDWQTSATRY